MMKEVIDGCWLVIVIGTILRRASCYTSYLSHANRGWSGGDSCQSDAAIAVNEEEDCHGFLVWDGHAGMLLPSVLMVEALTSTAIAGRRRGRRLLSLGSCGFQSVWVGEFVAAGRDATVIGFRSSTSLKKKRQRDPSPLLLIE
ncbi:hypothetical protein ACLOJK_038649 [Asimina triloba]